MKNLRFLLWGLMLVACGEPESGGSPGWVGTVDTLADGRVVVTSPNAPIWVEPPVLRELFRVGTFDEEGAELFGGIGGLELGSDGTLFVLDDQASEVRVFGPDGTFQRAFGGEGEGPGELQSPAGLAFDSAGTLWLLNWGNGRYSGFDPRTGTILREPRRQAAFASFPWRGAFVGGDRLLDVALDRSGEEAIIGLNDDFVPTDTLPLPQPPPDSRVSYRRGAVQVASLAEPFAPLPAWAPRPHGGVVLGDGKEYRLHRVELSGDTTLTMVLRRDAVSVTEAERDSALAFFRRMSESLGDAEPDRTPNARRTKPAHGALFVDDEDRTWVRGVPPADEAPFWDVFGADGRFLGQVTLPDAVGFLPPVLKRGRMAVASQTSGFPMVIVYELVEPTG